MTPPDRTLKNPVSFARSRHSTAMLRNRGGLLGFRFRRALEQILAIAGMPMIVGAAL